MAPLPEEVRKTIRKDHWQASEKAKDHHRRSIYLFVRRNLRFPFLEAFDRPDANASCARRSETTIAPQALTLLNSELALNAARNLAGRLLADPDSPPHSRLERAWMTALGRRAADEELALARDFLGRQIAYLEGAGRAAAELVEPFPPPAGMKPEEGAAWTALCLAILNLNEFVYID